MSEYFQNKVAAADGCRLGHRPGMVEKLLAEGAMAVFMGDISQDNLTKESERLNPAYPARCIHARRRHQLDQVESPHQRRQGARRAPRLRVQQRRGGDDRTHRTGDLRLPGGSCWTST